jgi:hypothetical protein
MTTNLGVNSLADETTLIGLSREDRMTLKWKSYGDHGQTAEGTHGTWRVVTCGRWWHLSVQPKWTRGMLSRGKFGDRLAAMSTAEMLDETPEVPAPQNIEAT